MIEEWCGYAPGRLIPMIMIPLWDPMRAAIEIERCASKGARCITFPENPTPLGWPSLHDPGHYWDAVFAACAEAGLVVNVHGGSSSAVSTTSDDMPFIQLLVWNMMSLPPGSCLDFIFSDIFARHPDLKVCFAEGGIGWMPTMLERCERVYDRHRFWANRYRLKSDGVAKTVERLDVVRDLDGMQPLQLFKKHIFGCFFEDFSGVREMQHLGLLDNILMETDYPHSDTTWPDCIATAQRQLSDLSFDEAQRVMVGNACELYRFQPNRPPRAIKHEP